MSVENPLEEVVGKVEEEEEEEEMISVLYNSWYGGWGISDEAKRLYNERREQLVAKGEYTYVRMRCNPILVGVFEELGEAFNGEHCHAAIERIPKKYENYFYLGEYDGKEDVGIDYEKYKADHFRQDIQTILENVDLTDASKVVQLKELFMTVEDLKPHPVGVGI